MVYIKKCVLLLRFTVIKKSDHILVILVTLGMYFSTLLPPAQGWEHQEAFGLVFSCSLKVVLASATAFFWGEYINSYLLSKFKVLVSGKYYALRVILSTSVGALVDSAVFCYIVFYGVLPLPAIFQMLMLNYVFKVGYEVVTLPAAYLLIGYLKKSDNIDYYDFQTNYNPFSLKLS